MTKRSPAETLAELCEPYHRDQRPAGVGLTIVADNVDAKKLLAAFYLCPLPPWTRPRSKMPVDTRQRWLWLWSGFEGGPMEPTFLDDLARAAGISAQTAYTRWPSLMSSRLVLPDGTIAEVARGLLSAFVAQHQRVVGANTQPRKKGNADVNQEGSDPGRVDAGHDDRTGDPDVPDARLPPGPDAA